MTKTTKAPGAGRERPILFSPEMVLAVLARTKTQTRRIERGGPDFHTRARLLSCVNGVATHGDSIPDDPVPIVVGPRFGAPGDRLWIRERWYPATKPPALFAADVLGLTEKELLEAGVPRWFPSIHLKKEYARPVRLPISAHERVERLQDISEDDAKAEGVGPEFEVDAGTFLQGKFDAAKASTYRLGYKHLWDRINGPRGFPWSLNPWVGSGWICATLAGFANRGDK